MKSPARAALVAMSSVCGLWALAFADPIYWVTDASTDRPTPLCLGGDCFSQILMASWTSSVAFENVSIFAELGADNSSASLTAFLTNAVGPGTTDANQIASVTLTPPFLDSPGVLLFSGLSLGPGTYFLVLSGPATETSFSYWYEYNLPTVSTAAGVSAGSFGMANVADPSSTPNKTYAPASTFDTVNSAVLSIQIGTVPLQSQTIAFGPLGVQTIVSSPLPLSATASSGLAVTFISNTTSVCTISGTYITLIAAGTCSITATQGGNSIYAPANPVTASFTVDPTFADVSSTGPDANVTAEEMEAIDLMLANGITSGCSNLPFDYCPGDSVTRGQMAVFIVRSILGTNDFTYTTTPYFTDVTSDPTDPNYSQFFKYIQKLKDLGITSGCTATTYCPNDTVSRGQMAVFIMRARYGVGFAFNYTMTPYFTDVVASPEFEPDGSVNPDYSQFFEYIQKMRDVGITSGCTATTYCPNDDVTRGQMALFIMRGGFNQLLPSGTPVISSVSPATGTIGNTVNVTITGTNTSFASGTTTVSAEAGFAVQNVVVNSATSLTAQLVIASNARLGPESIVVTTGAQEAVAPNGFTITSDPATGAIAYWTGNGTNANAMSGISGTLENGATYAPATSRTQGLADAQAFSLNGINSYVQAASSEAATVSGARTLVAWVYPNVSTGPGQPILSGGSTYAAGDIFGITGTTGTCSTGGQYQLYIDDGGTCYVSNISLAPNTWSLVAVTFDGTNAVFYVNNVASTPVAAQMIPYGLSTYEIGGNTLGGTSSGASFNGLLNEVQIYDRALSPVEIQGLYSP